MTETADLLRLMSWLSPVFPTGGFAYSAGLEQAVADGVVADEDGLQDWIETLITCGSPWNDAVLFAASWRSAGNGADIGEIAQLGEALAGSAERHAETMQQGRSFLLAARHWIADGDIPEDLPLPVAAGAACGLTGIALETALSAFVHAFATNQLQCAIRLSVTGQDGAARILARLEPTVSETARKAAASSLDDLGVFAPVADMAVMRHETLEPRLFRS